MNFKSLLSVGLMVLLSGCATLPSNGPTGSQIRKTAINGDDRLAIKIIEVDGAAALPAKPVEDRLPLTDPAPPPTDMVGPGDVLGITIYEAGVALFGGSLLALPTAASGADPSVKAQTLPPIRVNDDGNIVVPYAGKLHVVGKTVDEIQIMIRNGLRGMSENPQVVVTIENAITNTVIVGGEVGRPGRLVLQTNRERLSDVIALAGGYRGNAKDLVLRLGRRNTNYDVRLSDVFDKSGLDVRAYPGDRISVVSDPNTFSVLGAAGRVEQQPFSKAEMSLVEAIASAGGPNPNLGDPAAIFVFRYVPDEQGKPRPVVYHINMTQAGGYFLAQNFALRDKDVLYFGNARANQPSKLIQLISQLFSPIVTVTSAVQVLKN